MKEGNELFVSMPTQIFMKLIYLKIFSGVRKLKGSRI